MSTYFIRQRIYRQIKQTDFGAPLSVHSHLRHVGVCLKEEMKSMKGCYLEFHNKIISTEDVHAVPDQTLC